MSRSKVLIGGTLATLMLAASAVTAFAGEVTGNGGDTNGPANANSICVFSGQNDFPDVPTTGDPNSPGGRSQSYGQENRLGLIDPHAFNPGDACGGGSNFARQK
jgi:hypothetical protein